MTATAAEYLPGWFYQAVSEYCESAAQKAGVESRWFRIGGQTIRLRFIGGLPAGELTRALAHMAAPADSAAELTVSLFDGESAGVTPPFFLKTYLHALAHNWVDFTGPRGTLADLHDPPFHATYHPGTDVLSLLHPGRREGFYFRRTPRGIPYYEVASPLRTMLHAWFRSQGMQFVHAAAVGTAEGGVLLAGKGNSGKSTSALACLNGGLLYAGDDYCLVGARPGYIHSLYNTCKLVDDSDVRRFPGLDGRIWNPVRGREDKPTVFLHEHWPEMVSAGFPLRAIVLPRISGHQASRIVPASGMEALAAIAPSTLAQLPLSGAADLHFLKDLVASVPVRTLEAGVELRQIPAVIGELLAELPA